jgi:hypothetical protein
MDDGERCTGNSKRSGKRCKKSRCVGLDKCAAHCGLSKQERDARAGAFLANQQAVKAVITYGLPRDISPTDALLEEVRYTAGHVAWLREMVQSLDPDVLVWGVTEEAHKTATEFGGVDTTWAAKPSAWLELYFRERKHLLDVTKAAISVGIEERVVRLAEAQGQLVNATIRRILARLELSDAQSKLVPKVVPEELRRAAASALN